MAERDGAMVKVGAVLRDAEIRGVLVGDLAEQDELDLCGLTRVDVAVVNAPRASASAEPSRQATHRQKPPQKQAAQHLMPSRLHRSH